MFRDELRTQLLRPALRWWPLIFAVCGVVAAVWPTVVFGDNVTLGPVGALQGLSAGAALACILGPVAIALSTGQDWDLGTRRVRLLSGTRCAPLSACQLGFGMVVALGAPVAVAGTTFVASMSDYLRRELAGPAAPTAAWADVSSTKGGVFMLLALLSTLAMWALVLACRSGRLAMAVLGASLVSWFVLLSQVQQPAARELLGLHPLSPVWRLLDPWPSERLSFTGSWWIMMPAAVCWVALLTQRTISSLRAPG